MATDTTNPLPSTPPTSTLVIHHIPANEPSSMKELLKLSTQLSSFSEPSQFAEFFSEFLTHKTLETVDLRALTFGWFYNSLHLLNSKQFNKGLAIAKEINKTNITNPLKKDLLNSNKQIPEKKENANEDSLPLTFFDLPDDIFSKTYSFLPFQDISNAMTVCKHFALVGFRAPTFSKRKITILVPKIMEGDAHIYPGMWKRFRLCKELTFGEFPLSRAKEHRRRFINTFRKRGNLTKNKSLAKSGDYFHHFFSNRRSLAHGHLKLSRMSIWHKTELKKGKKWVGAF